MNAVRCLALDLVDFRPRYITFIITPRKPRKSSELDSSTPIQYPFRGRNLRKRTHDGQPTAFRGDANAFADCIAHYNSFGQFGAAWTAGSWLRRRNDR